MPRIIPVIDVLRGRAVHARGGRRDDYGPVRSVLRPGSDPIALAAAFRDVLGLAEIYLADLDAIAGAPPSVGLYRDLADLGLSTWIDAGLRDGSGVAPLLASGVGRVVVGLETVAGRGGLRRICRDAGPGRVVLSLDLRVGRPVVAPGADWSDADAGQIVASAVEEGVGTVILLDLARVGGGRGVGTIGLLERLAGEHAEVEWVVGGGVAGREDIERLGRSGASAVLVASALHDGRIAAADPGRSEGPDRGP
jgi:phosphoribosylformimino-5-aminoimidazole carboxamide ribotide isomerase